MDYYNNDYLMHYGVKGMKWGKRKAKYEYTYAYGQKPKNAYQKVARSLGGTKLAKGAINISGMSDAQKKNALKEQALLADEKAYNKAAKKAHKTGGQMTYDVATGKYDVKLTPEQQKAARRKTAIKVGVAVAGTALAAYGAVKVHNFVREKNQEIRVNEGKAKCDRMLKKLDRMHLNDLVKGSTATESWVKTGKQKTPFQYNNNGKSVTIPRQYRNPQSALKPMQYRNIENKVIDKTISEAYDKARNDSFKTAAKNVSRHYLEEAKRYARNRQKTFKLNKEN